MSFQVGDTVVRNENNLSGFWERSVGPARLRGEFVVTEAGRYANEIKLEGVTTIGGRPIGLAADRFTLVRRSSTRIRVGDTVVRKINHQSSFWRSQVGSDVSRPIMVRRISGDTLCLEGISESFTCDRFLKIG